MTEIDINKLTRNYKEEPLGKLEAPVKEDLEYLYMGLGMTVQELVEYFNKQKSSIGRWLKKYNIKKGDVKSSYTEITKEELNLIDWSKMSRNFLDKPWVSHVDKPIESDFKYLYSVLNLSVKSVATIMGLSPDRVQKIVGKFGIKKNQEQQNEARAREVKKIWGVDHISKVPEIQKKKEETCLKNNGVKSMLCKKEVREDCMEQKYGNKHALCIDKFKKKQEESLMKSHNVRNVSELQDIAQEGVQRRYGVNNVFELPEVQQKAANTKIAKYGTSNNMLVPEIREKVYTTNEEKYGVNGSPLKSPVIREKIKQTNINNYGVDSIMKVPEMQHKMHNALNDKIRKYGITAHPSYAHIKHKENFNKEYWLNNFVDKRNNAFEVGKCALYHGVGYNCISNVMRVFGIILRHKRKSIQEYTIARYFNDLGFDIKQSYKKLIGPKELDIYVPELNIAVEYDGLMYHSIGLKEYRNGGRIDTRYHLRKTNECEEKGVQLFHIFENEWLNPNKRDIWMSMLSAKTGCNEIIYARNTNVKEISAIIANKFCEENHIQGPSKTSKNYGLYTKNYNELVAVMTFSKARFNKDCEWELVRFCSKKYITVIGAASKLLKEFRKHNAGRIISYANRRWSTGNLYEKLGFTKVGVTPPNYFYFETKDGITPKDMVLYSRIKFQKHKLADLLKNFDPRKSEPENMYANGYRAIYDCGNLVYILD